MIQQCSGCGTRWNVRDRQRAWCPRCRGALLPPTEPGPQRGPQWGPGTAGQSTPTRLPSGYRWIAVRPGAPPPARPRRRPLGPTPKYPVMPRWGLVEQVGQGLQVDAPAGVAAASPANHATLVAPARVTMAATLVVLGVAALVHLVRYVLLVINRNTLLNPLVAASALWLGVAASVAAVVATIVCATALTRWLIARRAAAFGHAGLSEWRRRRALWAGCLLPPAAAVLVALALAFWLATREEPPSWALMAGCVALGVLPLVASLWALVYLLELVHAEGLHHRLGASIWLWWSLWMASSAMAVFATETSFARDAQGIANNTAATIGAYVLAAVVVIAAARVFEGFERKPVERPAHRWLVVGDDGSPEPVSASRVELEGQEPAA